MASYTLHESQNFVDKINYKNYQKSSQNILDIFKDPFIAIHAVYSKEKLYKYIRKYKGIETDIVYKNNNFYIAHDDIENIEKYTIKLNNIFTYINEFKDTNVIYGGGELPILWLDCKNINNINYQTYIEDLIKLIDDYNIDKSKIIIESDKIVFLQHFKNVGFMTSYMFDPLFNKNIKGQGSQSDASISRPSREEIEMRSWAVLLRSVSNKEFTSVVAWFKNFKNEIFNKNIKAQDKILKENTNIVMNILQDIDKYDIDFISSNVKNYYLLKNLFPNIKKNYWFSGSSLQMKIRSIYIRYIILKDKNTGVLLLDY